MHALEICGVCAENACLGAQKGTSRTKTSPPSLWGTIVVPCPGDSGTSNTNIRMGRRKICPGLGELDERALRGTQPPSHCGLACRAT